MSSQGPLSRSSPNITGGRGHVNSYPQDDTHRTQLQPPVQKFQQMNISAGGGQLPMSKTYPDAQGRPWLSEADHHQHQFYTEHGSGQVSPYRAFTNSSSSYPSERSPAYSNQSGYVNNENLANEQRMQGRPPVRQNWPNDDQYSMPDSKFVYDDSRGQQYLQYSQYRESHNAPYC